MTDIHTIKNLINFLPYLKTETWYMLGIGIMVYGIYIGYLIAFERYYKAQQNTPRASPEKSPIHDLLESINLDDACFFERLSLIVRTHLEESRRVPLATKKTPRDISGEFTSPELREVLEICTYHEYTGETAEREKKKMVVERLKSIL